MTPEEAKRLLADVAQVAGGVLVIHRSARQPPMLSAENPVDREDLPRDAETLKAVLPRSAYTHREGDFLFSTVAGRSAAARTLSRVLARVLPGAKVRRQPM